MSIAFYRFSDEILEEILEEEVVIVDDLDPSDDHAYVVYQPWDRPDHDDIENKEEDGVKIVPFREFIKEHIGPDLAETYFFERFCHDNNIECDEDEAKTLLNDASVDTFEKMYDNYISARAATVHVVDTDLKPHMGKQYTNALCEVFDTDDWIDGDLVIVRKCLERNDGRFVVASIGEDIELIGLDFTVDKTHGGIPLKVVSEYPVCYWSFPFKHEGEKYPTVKANSLVFVGTSIENIENIILKREEIMTKVDNHHRVEDRDRLIVFTNDDVRYGIICEYGLGNIADRDECDRIFNATKEGFYMQFPRFKNVLATTEIYNLADKRKFMTNMIPYKINETYKNMITMLVDHYGVAPNHIGFIDCGEL